MFRPLRLCVELRAIAEGLAVMLRGFGSELHAIQLSYTTIGTLGYALASLWG